MKLKSFLESLASEGILKESRALRPLRIENDLRRRRRRESIDNLAERYGSQNSDNRMNHEQITIPGTDSQLPDNKSVSLSNIIRDIPYIGVVTDADGNIYVIDPNLSGFILDYERGPDGVRRFGFPAEQFRLPDGMIYITLSTEWIMRKGGIYEGMPFWES